MSVSSFNNSSTHSFTSSDIDRIAQSLSMRDKIEGKTNKQLSDLFLTHVWARMILGSPEEMIADELLTRFDERCGIERDDNGEIVP